VVSQAGFRLSVHGVNGAGVSVVAERLGIRKAATGQVTVAQMGRQGFLAYSDGVKITRIVRGDVTNLYFARCSENTLSQYKHHSCCQTSK
jgi:hypothetical protein